MYLAVFERVGLTAGMAYLDAGCGAGMAAQIGAGRGAQVSGLDAAPDLLAIARSRVPSGDFHVGDLESLPFPDEKFDFVTGFQFISICWKSWGRTWRSEARYEIRCSRRDHDLGQAGGMEAASLVAALRPLLPPPPPGAPGPFAFSDEAALRAFAAGVGLEPLEVFDVNSPWRYPDLSTALRGLGSSGVAARAIENAGEDAVNKAHAKALAPFRQSDGSYKIGASFRCLLARP